MGLKIVPPNSLEKVEKQIKALKSILKYDNPKDKAIHENAISDLEKQKDKLLRGIK